jgi:hypothetical protein
MNRHQRRAAQAAARSKSVDRVIRIHEAGHCVGRYVTAPLLGWAPDEVIFGVDVYATPSQAYVPSLDASRVLGVEATTWGMFLSKPMDDFLRAKHGDPAGISQKDIDASLFSETRGAGIDVDMWFHARTIFAIFGPLAEAKFEGKAFEGVFNDYSSEHDVCGIVREGTLIGRSTEQIEEAIAKALALAEAHIAKPAVWRAILAVADQIRAGRTPGQVIVRAIEQAIEHVGS